MSEEKKRDEEVESSADGETADAETVDVNAKTATDEPEQAAQEAEADQDQPAPQITLDRYMSRRRAPLRSTWSQMASLFFMLLALILLFVYKNRCGIVVSDFFGHAGTGSGAPAQTAPAPTPPTTP